MKVIWLNAEKKAARIVRGHLWWKREAFVHYRDAGGSAQLKDGWVYRDYVRHWVYTAINTWVESDLDIELNARRHAERTWSRAGRTALPAARPLSETK